MDYEEYDLTPYEEESAQIGEIDFRLRSRLEYQAIVGQLERMFGNLEEHGIWLEFKGCPHDFGTYYELRMNYREWNEYTRLIDSDFPRYWDKQALAYLNEKGYFKDHPDKVRTTSNGEF